MRPCFTNIEKCATASDGAIKLTDAAVRDNFERCLSPKKTLTTSTGIPRYRPKLESIEGMILDKVKGGQLTSVIIRPVPHQIHLYGALAKPSHYQPEYLIIRTVPGQKWLDF